MAVLKKNIREEGIIFIMSITVLIMMIMLHEAKGDEEHPQVPCFFIFGDSLVDNGNNNQLETIIKVNNKPYGIDFPGGIATGRFSNGRNVVDIIGEALGFKTFIPPFASVLNGNAALITRGVNYGSGGSGIRNDTGKIVGTLLNLEAQVNHHLMTVAKIKSMLGINEGEAHLNKCIYFVGMGGSDYLTNYFLPDVQSTSRDYAPQQYARVLIKEYKVQILRLYNNGARKFALNGIGALGCTPFAINSLAKKTGSRNGCTCAEKVNEAVQFFNHELILLVEHFNIHYPKAKFIYLNYFGIGSSDPILKERKVINKSCCPLNGLGLCNTAASPCPDRKTYLFWDSFHLTEAASVLIVKRYYNSQLQSDSYPIDIKRLAELKL